MTYSRPTAQKPKNRVGGALRGHRMVEDTPVESVPRENLGKYDTSKQPRKPRGM